jgi:CHAT domain-containing protein/tetratricopeptide (TPR) repeat protein
MRLKNLLSILLFFAFLKGFAQQEFAESYQKMVQEAQAKNYAQAALHGEQAEPFAEKALGKGSEKLGSFYYNLGNVQFSAGNALKAEQAYKKCIEIRKTLLGVQNPDYIKTVDKLSQLYIATGRQADSDKLLAQLKKEQNTNSTSTNTDTPTGKESPEFAKTLTNQALGQIQAGKWQEAEKNLVKALDIYQKNKIENTDFAVAADAFGVVLGQKNKFKEALPLFEQAYNIRKSQLGETHANTQATMFNLAVCYESLRQTNKARGLYEQLLAIYEKNNPQSNPKYTEVLASLGQMYLNNKDIDNAAKALQKALEIEKNKANTSTQYAQLLNDLARLEFIRKNYQAAENYSRLGLEISEKKYGKNSIDYANALLNLGNTLKLQNKNSQAEKIYQQSLQILKQIKQEKSAQYLQANAALAELHAAERRYEQAIKIYLQILPEQKAAFGEEDRQYWQNLANMADCYVALQKYKEARPYFEELINIQAASQSPSYPKWMMALGAFYYEIGKYQEAEAYFEQSLRSYEENINNQPVAYIEALENLANLYKNQGRYSESEKLYREALKVCKEKFGESHFTYTNLQNNLGSLYKSLGKFEEAEKIYKKSLMAASKEGENTAQYAQVLNDMAVLYEDAGKFAEAEPLLNKALEIRKKIFTEQSAEYAETLQNLATLYKQMGRYQEAATQYQKVLAIRKEVLGQLHPEYATTLNALASLYKRVNNLEKAEPLYLEALEIRKNFLGEENPEYAFSLENLANYYSSLKQYTKAEPLYKQAVAIKKKVFGANHPVYAGSLNNLAVLYESNKQYTQAEQMYKEALAILKTALGEKHPKYIASLNNLAMFYENQQKFEVANGLYRQLAKNTLEQIRVNFTTLSENEKRQFFATNKPFLDNFILFSANAVARKAPESDALAQEAFQLLITTKGIVLNSTGRAKKEILSGKDQSLIAQYEEWLKLREMIAKLYNVGQSELKKRNINLDSLEKKSRNLEKELSSKSKSFDEAFNTKLIDWKEIQKRLKDQEALIEMARIQNSPEKVLYVVFILKKSTVRAPEIFIINNGLELEQGLAFYKNNIRFRREDNESYNTYWKVFEPYLEGIQKVYMSGDGVYTQINPMTLFNPAKKQFLVESLQISLLTNGKELIDNKNIANASGKALLIGNPSYQISKQLSSSAPIDLSNQEGFWLQNSTFSTLPATEKEVENIERILARKNLQTKKILGVAATEAALKSEINGSYLVHIATHGFFIPSRAEEESSKIIHFEEDIDEKQDDPMLRSGLILAGVTDYFREEKKNQDQEDGILTAYEVMNLDLSNTSLVALSACETGLGKVQAGEGVYGLQRAFKIAGAQSLLMSLWKVDDTATQELMQTFYEEWSKTNNKISSFRNAQNKMREKYKHPYYWGAFVMIGE